LGWQPGQYLGRALSARHTLVSVEFGWDLLLFFLFTDCDQHQLLASCELSKIDKEEGRDIEQRMEKEQSLCNAKIGENEDVQALTSYRNTKGEAQILED